MLDRIRKLYSGENPLGRLWRWAKRPKAPGKRAKRFEGLSKWAKKKARQADPPLRALWDKRRLVYRKAYRKAEKRARKRRKPATKIVTTAGSPHWGGSDDILELEVEPIARLKGFEPNSAKRSACYGNCGSDHHTSQTYASARDFPTVNNHALAQEIRTRLAGGLHRDYEHFYFTRNNRRYRGQIIAQTHGTGPHLHVGIRKV